MSPLDPELAGGVRTSRVPAGLVEEVRMLVATGGVVPLPPPPRIDRRLSRLGRLLVFDPILSGNRDIACMTCHLPRLATTDGRHLSIGQGGSGLGPERVHPDGAFIGRNAPPLFNLHTLRHLFLDGRVSVDAAGWFHTPAGDQLTPDMAAVLEFGAVSALGLFPVASRKEMRGFGGNEIAALADDDFQGVWSALMRRLGAIDRYRKLFEAAYPETRFEDMSFAHASNAMAAFMLDRFSFDRSPWDRFLAGRNEALTLRQLQGAKVFLEGSCVGCHGGPSLSDESLGNFHNVALAQLGPGTGDGPGTNDDFGRERVTGRIGDRYRFRSTPLRNVDLTGPFGHAGQFISLRDFIDHYSESDVKLRAYDASQLQPLLRGTVLDNTDEILARRAPALDKLVLTDEETDLLVAFMGSLTDRRVRNLAHVVPRRVPSGLPVDRR